MHEILTLQLGQRSNYVATHFWNTQESYFTYSSDQDSLVDHDIIFRSGIGADGSETFTPRTVIYDLKGGFGSLRKINALYEIDEPVVPDALWNGPTVVQRQTAIQQHVYQQSLEEGLVPPKLTTESVRYWSDFSRVFFHPKSIVQLNDYELNSSLMPFENWSAGEDLFNSLDKEHDLLDRDLRPFAEEADQMQGIQMMAGIDDAWGGFAAKYIDRLKDEYGKTAIWVWGMEDGIHRASREKRFVRLSNTARFISEITSQASAFIPMALPTQALPNYVSLNPQSQWQVSGLLSLALESMTLPTRLKPRNGNRETLDALSNILNVNGNQTISKLEMSVDSQALHPRLNGHHRPGRLEVRAESRDSRIPSQDRSSELDGYKAKDGVTSFDMDFYSTEATEQRRERSTIDKLHVFGQAEHLRGSEELNPKDSDEEDDGLERARRRAAGLPVIKQMRTPMSFPLLDSFPHIFGTTAPSLSITTSLSTDTSISSRVKNLRKIVSRAIGIDERESLSNSLGEIAEVYEEGWDSGSDSDDD